MSKANDDRCIISTIQIDPNELNNNQYDSVLTQNGKFNGLPDIFSDVDINGPHRLNGHYFKDGFHTPYTLYDGKFSAHES